MSWENSRNKLSIWLVKNSDVKLWWDVSGCRESPMCVGLKSVFQETDTVVKLRHLLRILACYWIAVALFSFQPNATQGLISYLNCFFSFFSFFWIVSLAILKAYSWKNFQWYAKTYSTIGNSEDISRHPAKHKENRQNLVGYFIECEPDFHCRIQLLCVLVFESGMSTLQLVEILTAPHLRRLIVRYLLSSLCQRQTHQLNRHSILWRSVC